MFLCPFLNNLQPQITGRRLREDGRAAGCSRTDSSMLYISKNKRDESLSNRFFCHYGFVVSLETRPVSSSDFVFIYYLNSRVVSHVFVLVSRWNSQNWKRGVLFCFRCYRYRYRYRYRYIWIYYRHRYRYRYIWIVQKCLGQYMDTRGVIVQKCFGQCMDTCGVVYIT